MKSSPDNSQILKIQKINLDEKTLRRFSGNKKKRLEGMNFSKIKEKFIPSIMGHKGYHD